MQRNRAYFGTWRLWFPFALLALVFLLLFHRLLSGDALFWGLPSLQFYPWREFAMSEIAQGRVPLWNPYNGAGVPLLANYQSALLYPPNLLYWLLPGAQTMTILGILHLALAGYGMWRLTGYLECPWLGRGIATLAYPLSSTLVARFGNPAMLDTAAWLPWLLLATLWLLNKVTLWRIIALAAIGALQLLAGHAQWTFYSFLLVASCGLWRFVRARSAYTLRQTVTVILAALVAILLGVSVTAAQLLPTAELQQQSQRASGLEESFALNFSYAPLSLVTLINPNFFGNPGDGSYAINGEYFETTAYVGLLPLTLSLLGCLHLFRLWLRKRKRSGPMASAAAVSTAIPNSDLIGFLALAVVISLLLAFGKFTPLYPLLYRYVPTFSLFQAPARWLLVTVFSISLLAALVVPLWKPDRRAVKRARIAVMGGIVLIVTGGSARLLLHAAPALTVQLLHGITTSGVLILVVGLCFVTQPSNEKHWKRWAMAILAFVALDLLWANALSNPTVPARFYDRLPSLSSVRTFWPDAQNQQLPQAVFDSYLPPNDYQVGIEKQDAYRASDVPDLNLLDRQPSLNDFDPLRPASLDRFTQLLNESVRPALLQAAAVGRVSTVSEQAGTVQSPMTRAWMVPVAVWVADSEAAQKAVSEPDWNPEHSVILEGSAIIPPSTNAGSAVISYETPSAIVIAVDSPDGGVLVLADTYYPGWQTALDGTSTALYRANVNFRGVLIPTGKHIVTMSYEPDSWRIGVMISLGALVAMMLLIVVAAVRNVQTQKLRSSAVDAPQ